MHNADSAPKPLPHALYTAAQVRNLDRIAIEELGVGGRTLMERAGKAAFAVLQACWPGAREVLVLCGDGNNGGDGYVVARLAREAGLSVRVFCPGDPARLKGDALACAQDLGVDPEAFSGSLPREADVLVDGLLGTGLQRDVEGAWRTAIEAMNDHQAPVLALDIPSGLDSDTGARRGIAVRARHTVSFIGLKQGLFTGDGPECCGTVHFDTLQVPPQLYAREIVSTTRMDLAKLQHLLAPRPRSFHKGNCGHVLVVGGAPGMVGAARMAGEAAARTGAGMVSVAVHPSQTAAVTAARPELMCHGVAGARDLKPLIGRADVIAIGPGLGRGAWSGELLGAVLETPLPLVVDADALNLLSASDRPAHAWVLTPHPGEAARLLGCSSAAIQADRFEAVRTLQQRTGGVVVLKGAGSLVCRSDARISVCSAGNPGMATGGMGDVLTGVIAGLLAQGFSLDDAAMAGVCVHASAGDLAAREGERGLLATDLMPYIRRLVNPEIG